MKKAEKKMTEKEIEKFAPSYKKNLDHLKLLLINPEIKKVIEETRESLNIPLSGFDPDRDPDAIQRWNDEMNKKSYETITSKAFHDQVRNIRSKKDIGQPMAEKQLSLQHDKLPENRLARMINKLIEECGLPLNYEDSIRTYIVTGIFSPPPFPFSISSVYDENETSDPKKTLNFKFYSKPTHEDLKSVSRFMAMFPNHLPQSPEPIKGFDRKKKMAEMKSGNKVEMIFNGDKQERYKMTSREIAQEIEVEFGMPTTAGNVDDAPRELNTLWKKRFKKKPGK